MPTVRSFQPFHQTRMMRPGGFATSTKQAVSSTTADAPVLTPAIYDSLNMSQVEFKNSEAAEKKSRGSLLKAAGLVAVGVAGLVLGGPVWARARPVESGVERRSGPAAGRVIEEPPSGRVAERTLDRKGG